MKTQHDSPFTSGHSALTALGAALWATFTVFTAVPRAPAQISWGHALSLDGLDDYVVVDPGVMLSNTSFSLEFWAQRQTLASIQCAVSQGTMAPNQGLHILFNGDTVAFNFWADDLAGIQPADSQWHHWAFTYEAADRARKIFRDGVVIAHDTAATNYLGSGPLYLGGYLGGTYCFSGGLDDVRIWSVARSEADIAANRNQPLTGAEANLVAYWKLDEGGGASVFDATTNHFNGTLMGGAVWTVSSILPFVRITTEMPGVIQGAAAWGDYDNDGLLDVLLTGSSGLAGGYAAAPIAQIWRNTGTGFNNVTASVAPGLPGVMRSAVAWADYDQDGRLDFLLMGTTTGYPFTPITQLWRNTGSGFSNVTAAVAPGLPGRMDGSIAWGDYDRDGRLDFLLVGSGSCQLWRNTGGGFVDVTAAVALAPYPPVSAAWGDYDNDGRVDILLTGNGDAAVWRNTGARFVEIRTSLPPLHQGSVAWGDCDNDGRLDFVLTGYNVWNSTKLAQVWRNTGAGFTNLDAGLPGVYDSSVAWGDYDNDGRLDILVTGVSGNSLIGQVWRNTGVGFSNINAGLTSVQQGSTAWGDYDNDGRLDILLTGYHFDSSGLKFTCEVWRNVSLTSNTPPAAPAGLKVTGAGSAVLFSWNPASDAETPASGLTYNLRVGTTPGGSDLVSPDANASGGRRLAGMGNAQQAVRVPFTSPRTGPIYWSVQTVDSAFAGSPFAPEQSFNLWPVMGTAAGFVPGDTNGDGRVDQGELDAVLAAYWPSSPWLSMTNVAGLGGTNVTFALTNSTAGAFTVEASTNLTHWKHLGPATPRYEFTDTNTPSQPQRHYRLRWP